jgi:hypothetical protein
VAVALLVGYFAVVEQIRTFADDRCSAFCAFCGSPPKTRDHVPPKVFLDKPYPENLPVVGACLRCNKNASLNEEYVACLLEVAACGTVDPAGLRRTKIARTLAAKPRLTARLAASLESNGQYLIGGEDSTRLSAVIEKMARALWVYETSETAGGGGAAVRYAQIAQLSSAQLDSFRTLAPPDILPEVGSRLMFRLLVREAGIAPPCWIEVQPDRFSYAIETTVPRVKPILGDYLAAEVDLIFTESPAIL